MRVFVTGATGFIGSAVVRELLAAGHQVLGLARSDAGASALLAAGAQVHRGDIEDLDSLRRGVGLADGVIHTAFNHDFSKFAANCAADGKAIEAMGTALAGSERPLIVTTGTALIAPGLLATEGMPHPARTEAYPRVSEEVVMAVGATGVRACAVRLPPSVHGGGDHGFVPLLIDIARAKGVSAYVGDGLNRWPAVHRLDAACLFRLALERGAKATSYHGVAEEGVRFKDIAAVIGRHLGLPVVSKSPDEAADHFGWFAGFASLDAPASSQRTREQLGWVPTGPGLMEDLDGPGYFAEGEQVE